MRRGAVPYFRWWDQSVPATAVPAAAPAAVPATRAGAFLLRPGLVDRQRPAVDHLAVHPGDRGLGLPVGAHLDKPEPLRPAGVPVGDQLGRLDSPVGGEQLLELTLGDA